MSHHEGDSDRPYDHALYVQTLPTRKAALDQMCKSGQALHDFEKGMLGAFGDILEPEAVRFSEEVLAGRIVPGVDLTEKDFMDPSGESARDTTFVPSGGVRSDGD